MSSQSDLNGKHPWLVLEHLGGNPDTAFCAYSFRGMTHLYPQAYLSMNSAQTHYKGVFTHAWVINSSGSQQRQQKIIHNHLTFMLNFMHLLKKRTTVPLTLHLCDVHTCYCGAPTKESSTFNKKWAKRGKFHYSSHTGMPNSPAFRREHYEISIGIILCVEF